MVDKNPALFFCCKETNHPKVHDCDYNQLFRGEKRRGQEVKQIKQQTKNHESHAAFSSLNIFLQTIILKNNLNFFNNITDNDLFYSFSSAAKNKMSDLDLEKKN